MSSNGKKWHTISGLHVEAVWQSPEDRRIAEIQEVLYEMMAHLQTTGWFVLCEDPVSFPLRVKNELGCYDLVTVSGTEWNWKWYK